MIAQVWKDDQTVADVEDDRCLYAYEVPSKQDSSVMVEFNFYRDGSDTKRKSHESKIESFKSAQPRLMTFDPKTSISEVKRTLALYLKDMYKQDPPEADDLFDIKVRCNVPTVMDGYYKKRLVCEFCHEKHDVTEDLCDLEIAGFDCRDPKAAKWVTIQNVTDQMRYPRQLALAIVLKTNQKPNTMQLVHVENQDPNSYTAKDNDKKGVTLQSCFEGFTQTDKLTGDNQYYCRKCKEHRDSNKKLEVYKIPKLMMI